MENLPDHITLSKAELDLVAREHTRRHVLKLLEEIEEWIAQGRSLENYILIKRNLYTKSTS